MLIFNRVPNGPSCPLIPIISYNNLINENELFIRLNEKFKIKQCSVYIANAGDQLPCLSPGGALLATTTAKSHEINMAIKIKIIQELQFLISYLIGCFVICILRCKI